MKLSTSIHYTVTFILATTAIIWSTTTLTTVTANDANDANNIIVTTPTTNTNLDQNSSSSSSSYKYDQFAYQLLMEYRHQHNSNDAFTKIDSTSTTATATNNGNRRIIDSDGEESFTPTTPDSFIAICKDYLLSDTVVQDGLITTTENAKFFEHLCNVLPKPSCQNVDIPFHSLTLPLQFAFIQFICPVDATTSEKDLDCIEQLVIQNQIDDDFGYPITPQRDLEGETTTYCANLYALSQAFHFGTYSPSVKPSSVPTAAPTIVASILPTSTPSSLPSNQHSHSPSSSPSISAQPSFSTVPSMIPSHSPSGIVYRYKTSFTYMMGFDDASVKLGVLDDDDDKVDTIMTSTTNAIVKVLSSSPSIGVVQRVRVLNVSLLRGGTGAGTIGTIDTIGTASSNSQQKRQLQDLNVSTQLDTNGVDHKAKLDALCTSAFTIATDCIIVVSEVSLQSSTTTAIDIDIVNQSVYNSIEASMSDDTFVQEVGEANVKEVKYLNDGGEVSIDPRGEIGVGGGSIAGITIGSVLFVLLIAILVGRTRARSEDENLEVESIDSDDDSDLYENPDDDLSTEPVGGGDVDEKGNEKTRQLPMIEEHDDGSTSLMKDTGVQLDTTSGQVVGSTAISYVSSSVNSISSGYSADNPESPTRGAAVGKGDELVDQLDAAVHAGDWAAVAAIAGDLSHADDISTVSSFHSRAGDISYDPSERDNLSSKDAKRAAQIDQLITEGDWNAVGATAAAFQSEGGSVSSHSVPDNEKASSPSQGPKRRGLRDFIVGPWNSKAADKAIESDEVNGR